MSAYELDDHDVQMILTDLRGQESKMAAELADRIEAQAAGAVEPAASFDVYDVDDDYTKGLATEKWVSSHSPVRGIAEGGGTEVYARVHHFMRGWHQGEVISASVTAGEGQATLTYSDLGVLLDAYKQQASPVAEGGGITDAVEAMSKSLIGPAWETFDEGLRDTLRGIHRAALEAALPLLGLQQVPRVLLDEDAVGAAIIKAVAEYRGYLVFDGLGSVAAAAVMELAQQVPSREEIGKALSKARGADGQYVLTGDHIWDEAHLAFADAVLALFSKPAEEGS